MGTISGKKPAAEKNLTYHFTTDECCNFLQRRLDSIISAVNSQSRDRVPHVNIDLMTVRFGKKLRLFAITLPLTVLKNYSNANNELAIFHPKNWDDPEMDELFRDFLACFMFDEADRKYFKNLHNNSRFAISNRQCQRLVQTSTPVIQSFGNGVEYVVLLIDPIRVFHEMLKPDNGDTSPYVVWIDRTEQIRDGNFKYWVIQTTPGSKKDKKRQGGKLKDKHKAIENFILGGN